MSSYVKSKLNKHPGVNNISEPEAVHKLYKNTWECLHIPRVLYINVTFLFVCFKYTILYITFIFYLEAYN